MQVRNVVTNWDAVPVVLDPPYVARIFAVTPETVVKWLSKGVLPGYRVGRVWRISKDALQRHIADGAPS